MGPWLDDLSEDWVSQPRSSPGGSLPNGTPEGSVHTNAPNTTAFVSKIPRLRPLQESVDIAGAAKLPGLKAVREKSEDGTEQGGILNERSLSSINITIPVPRSNRPSKIVDEDRGRLLSRTISASTACTTMHQTIQKSHSASPQKGYETPEWKRRLLGGNVGYGDKRDLFSPMGLENIFRPPPEGSNRVSPIATRQEKSYMPSSPPGRKAIQVDDSFSPEDEGSNGDVLGDAPGSDEASLGYPGPHTAQQQRTEGGLRLSSFGEGQLDAYEFQELSLASSRPEDYDDDGENKPPLPELRPGAHTYFPLLQPSALTEDSSETQPPIFTQATTQVTEEKTSRRRKTTIYHDTQKVNVTRSLRRRLSHSRTRAELQSGIGENNGRDAPYSPVKDRTPKRRRTLHKDDSEISFSREVPAGVSEKSRQIQSIIGRKRKDAKFDKDSNEILSPEIVAMRQILRPRTPTPRQSRTQRKQQTPNSGGPNPSSPRRRTGQPDHEDWIEAQPAATANVRAATDQLAAMGIGKQVVNESRKGSVTTQEFLDEAMMVMHMIRSKGKPPGSGLASVEESESDGDKAKTPDIVQTGFGDESTREEFERPPSREHNNGTELRRRPAVTQDPRIVSHLRKFEDTTNVEDISTSLRSLNILKSTNTTQPVLEREPDHSEKIVSDPPNIRIIEGPENQQRKRKYSNSTVPSRRERQTDPVAQSGYQLTSSSASSASSARNRSVPTNSSTRSDTVHVIAPQAVQHLIPEHVAGMVFDRTKNMWVKEKHNHERSASELSDDPFKEISDLSVNEHEEMERIRLTASRPQTVNSLEHESTRNSEDHCIQVQDFGHDCDSRQRENQEMVDSSSPQSKYSRLASSGPKIETRATSWGESVPSEFLESHKRQQEVHTMTWKTAEEEHIEEVEHEIQVHEDRVDSDFDPSGNNERRRGLHIAFSSPLVSLRHHDVGNSPQPGAEVWEDASGLDYGDSSIDHFQDMEQSFQEISSQRASFRNPTKTGYRGAARRMSFCGRSFSARLVSRIEEQNEESIIVLGERSDIGRRASLGVTFSTPMPLRDLPGSSSMPPPTTGRRTNVSFHTSPLSDFTANPICTVQELEYSYIAQRRGDVSLTGIDCSFSVATIELVKRLTDVEPYEPYWEYIRSLELKQKSLMTLHGLESFCSRIEELDVSDNEIGQLSGVPTGIRHLKIANNCLSSLTAWGHLENLQYLDISGNEIDNLQGFANLVHLRELKADDNEIKSLEGIHRLDGLINISVQRNRLERVDFENSDLRHLQELDLRGNRIEAAKNLHCLTALTHLNLDDNNLEELTVARRNMLPKLHTLKLSGNKLRTVDITPFTELKILYLDRNRLGRVEGLVDAKHLDSLSMREQEWKAGSCARLNVDDAYEVRKLYLSGNIFPSFEPKIAFLNLQYLELANAGLATLPANFGQTAPNLRVLNLNSNALRDIRPLEGIVRLKKLLLAGNRLTRLRKTTNVLTKLQTITKLDLRNNPLTVGFYPSVTEGRLVRNITPSKLPADATADPFSLLNADEEADATYKARLDIDTKLKRRTYEMLLGFGCPCLKNLDGLVLDKETVLRRDECWVRLRELGILKYIGEGHAEDGLSMEKEEDLRIEEKPHEDKRGEKLVGGTEAAVTETIEIDGVLNHDSRDDINLKKLVEAEGAAEPTPGVAQPEAKETDTTASPRKADLPASSGDGQ